MTAQSSLPFGGGPFYVSVFWATFALWQGTELVLNTKRRSASPVGRSDRGSFRLLFLSLWMAIALDFASADCSALPGQVGQRPGVPAVDACGKPPALGAGTGGADRPSDQGDPLTVDQDVLEREMGRVGKERGQRQARTPFGKSRQART